MSPRNRITLCAATVLVALALAACGNQQAAQTETSGKSTETATAALPGNLKITSWGPEGTQAGAVFNKQPDGSAALWIRLDQPLTGDVAGVEFNGVLLEGNISGNLVTVGVPTALYAKPGAFKVHVIAREGDKSTQSNDVTFTVK